MTSLNTILLGLGRGRVAVVVRTSSCVTHSLSGPITTPLQPPLVYPLLILVTEYNRAFDTGSLDATRHPRPSSPRAWAYACARSRIHTRALHSHPHKHTHTHVHPSGSNPGPLRLQAAAKRSLDHVSQLEGSVAQQRHATRSVR